MQPIPDIPLAGIAWVLVGGLATRAYMPERMTLDVDIMIHSEDEQAARDAFTQAGYTITGPLSIGGFSVQGLDNSTIDVLISTAPWLDQALAHPNRDTAGYPVMPRPYLTLIKMQAGRPQDWTDVQRMLRDTPQEERVSTRALIVDYTPDLVEDYDSLVMLADWEFGEQ